MVFSSPWPDRILQRFVGVSDSRAGSALNARAGFLLVRWYRFMRSHGNA